MVILRYIKIHDIFVKFGKKDYFFREKKNVQMLPGKYNIILSRFGAVSSCEIAENAPLAVKWLKTHPALKTRQTPMCDNREWKCH